MKCVTFVGSVVFRDGVR